MTRTTIISTMLAAAASALATATATYAKTTTFSFTGTTLPTGLVASNYSVNSAGSSYLGHRFVPENAYVSDGYLNLLVNGEQQLNDYILSGEVTTGFSIQSTNVTTYAILTDIAGVCNGMFMYKNDTQEIDIEWLSDHGVVSNLASGFGRALFYTNQPVNGIYQNRTSAMGVPPCDVTSGIHAYRVEWVNGTTSFYVDGRLQNNFDTNVPTSKGAWVWNNWSNGDSGWAAGPPHADALFKISEIVMNYN